MNGVSLDSVKINGAVYYLPYQLLSKSERSPIEVTVIEGAASRMLDRG